MSFDAATGRLVNVANYHEPPMPSAAQLAAADAPGAALRLLAVAGLHPSGRPTTSWDSGMQAWEVAWQRSADGYPVPTDGVAVWVFADGTVRAISDIETPLEATPSSPIRADDALSVADRFVAGKAADYTLGTATLEWRQPNNFGDPAMPDAPAPFARLVRSVPFTITPADGEQQAGVVWVSAADGGIVGGSTVS